MPHLKWLQDGAGARPFSNLEAHREAAHLRAGWLGARRHEVLQDDGLVTPILSVRRNDFFKAPGAEGPARCRSCLSPTVMVLKPLTHLCPILKHTRDDGFWGQITICDGICNF